eukprot:26567-Chlamydomonas_euryale.AAC.3
MTLGTALPAPADRDPAGIAAAPAAASAPSHLARSERPGIGRRVGRVAFREGSTYKHRAALLTTFPAAAHLPSCRAPSQLLRTSFPRAWRVSPSRLPRTFPAAAHLPSCRAPPPPAPGAFHLPLCCSARPLTHPPPRLFPPRAHLLRCPVAALRPPSPPAPGIHRLDARAQYASPLSARCARARERTRTHLCRRVSRGPAAA